jgi:gag-polypeptide of LTR copia-type
LLKGCKSKEYPGGNAAIAWERLNKFEPVSAPSMIKLEKQFRTLSLKKSENPEVWITELEDLRIRLGDIGSTILDNQFMIHVLNNLTMDYDLQLALMEKRVGDSEKYLSIEEIKAEMNLHLERLNVSSNQSNEMLSWKNMLCLVDNITVIAVRLVIKLRNSKRIILTMSKTTKI